jgi:hypothetical protein
VWIVDTGKTTKRTEFKLWFDNDEGRVRIDRRVGDRFVQRIDTREERVWHVLGSKNVSRDPQGDGRSLLDGEHFDIRTIGLGTPAELGHGTRWDELAAFYSTSQPPQVFDQGGGTARVVWQWEKEVTVPGRVLHQRIQRAVVVDVRRRFAPIRMDCEVGFREVRDGQSRTNLTSETSWEERNDTVVPVRSVMEEPPNSGLRQVITFQWHSVNERIADDIFAARTLLADAEPGTLLADGRLGSGRTIIEARVPLSGGPAESLLTPKARSSWTRTIVIAVNVVIVLGILGIYLLRRRFRLRRS